MRLRFAADIKSLLWVAITIALVAVQFAKPALVPYLFWLSCYFALTCGVIAHNHNHSPTFHGKGANEVFASVISIFYGYPTFAWIPTHNLNHHKFVNRAGDATITWRYTNKHNALMAFVYPFVSGYYQADPTNAFIKKAKAQNPKLYRRVVRQYVVFVGAHVGLLSLAIGIHGVRTGLFVWGLSCAVPAMFALWTIMFFNYVQHVHTDPWSRHNHSRSFTGWGINFCLFNNGLHAAHHENAGMHWSKLPALHAKLAPNIDPRLMHRSMWGFVFVQYVVAPFFPKLGSQQVGRAPFEPPDGGQVKLKSADVGVADTGENEAMLPGF